MYPLTRCFSLLLCWIITSGLAFQVMASQTEPMKVVYHIDDAKVGRFALHIAEDQLNTNPDMKIVMVTYAGGVDFLLKGAEDKRGEPYAPQVQALLDRGVIFRVCTATLKFRDIPQEEVLPGLQFVAAGTYEIIRLQAEEDFAYLKP